MIRSLRFSTLAKSDVRKLLAQSSKKFGKEASVRYELLIQAALEAIAADPTRGRPLFPESPDNPKTFHLRYVTQRTTPHERVNAPRHMIIYFIVRDEELLISRILHEAMDVSRHRLPRKI